MQYRNYNIFLRYFFHNFINENIITYIYLINIFIALFTESRFTAKDRSRDRVRGSCMSEVGDSVS